MTDRFPSFFLLLAGLLFLASLSLTGCSTLQNSQAAGTEEGANAAMPPYFPDGVKDVQIPSELELNRGESMFINTSSYNGGILCFEGRVEVDSIADFFLTTMQKNGWKMAGSIRYKNVLMAFVKPNKSCIVKIIDTGISFRTKVNIYYTEDMDEGAAASYHSSGEIIR